MTLTRFTKWSYEHRPTTAECGSKPELIQWSWSCGCQAKLHTSLILTWSYLFTLLAPVWNGQTCIIQQRKTN